MTSRRSSCAPQPSTSGVPSGRCAVRVAARRGVGDGGPQRGEVEPGRWRVGGSVGAVEADDGVEVHEPAALVLGDLGVGQPGVLAELARP